MTVQGGPTAKGRATSPIDRPPLPPTSRPLQSIELKQTQAWYQQIAWTEEDLSAAISRRELRVRRARWALAHNRFPGALEGRLRALSALRRSALKRVHSIGHAANQQLRHVQEVAAAALAGLGSQHGTSGSASSGAIPTPAAGAEVAQVAEVAARAPGGASAGSGAEATHGGKQQQQQVEQCVERWAGHGAALGEAAEPMFCFERAVRLFAWSQLAYRCGAVECGFCIAVAADARFNSTRQA